MLVTNATTTRRHWLKQATTVVGSPWIATSAALGRENDQTAASERITLGIVGLGARGFHLIDAFLSDKDVQIVAICDVDRLHYRDRVWGVGEANGLEPAKAKIDRHYQSSPSAGVAMTTDFRELCGRDDLDAVVVATPDHWHALVAMEAMRKGKDVYCEKPLAHTFFEGQSLYRQAARHQRVFQTGSQQRSDPRFLAAADLVRSGRLGTIRAIETGLPGGYSAAQGDATAAAPPKTLDYDRWCGPAERLPYMRARHHRWWRGHRAYGGGVLMDWIGHHHDIAHLAIGSDRSGPISVEAIEWRFPDTPIYNTPEAYEIRCEYPRGIVSRISSQLQEGLKIVGDEGWVFVRRGRLEASAPDALDDALRSGPTTGYESSAHTRNFVDCIRSREACVAPAEVGHRSVTPGHLGYVSHTLRRKLLWDAEAEQVIDDQEANRLLQHHEYRSPWDQLWTEVIS